VLGTKHSKDGAIPFAPFIYAGAMTAFLWGSEWIGWYVRLLAW
jgi:prepilin signal peptidase PulO-like enzyme (type II secretory pathway)